MVRRKREEQGRPPIEAARERLARAASEGGPRDDSGDEVVSDEIAAEERARLAALERDPERGSRPHAPAPPLRARWREVARAQAPGETAAPEQTAAPAGAEGAAALGGRRPAGEDVLGPAESPDADAPGHAGDIGPSGGEREGEAPGPGARMDRTERTAGVPPPGRAPVGRRPRSRRADQERAREQRRAP